LLKIWDAVADKKSLHDKKMLDISLDRLYGRMKILSSGRWSYAAGFIREILWANL
jgi:hypothetical protein